MTIEDEKIWGSLPVPAFVVDPDDRVDALNPVAEAFLNSSARGLVGRSFFDLLVIDAPIEGALRRVRRDAAPLFINNVDVSVGARPSSVCNIQIAPVQGMLGFMLVMLEERQIAGRLGKVQSVKSAAKSAIGMAEMLAHEIKNPLAGITGSAQLLSMSLSGDDLELTDLIVAETRRIVKLLEQVEQFGNLRPPQRQVVNIHDLLDRAHRSATVGFAARMRIIENFDPSLPPTFVDGDQMIQVFLNLIKNAAEAADKKGGTITLRTFYEPSLRLRRKDGSGGALPLQVEVIDDGPGISPEMQNDLFEPFVSGRENGTGLGLALVSKIVAEHDGWIAVESVPGRTVFRISLPVAPKTANDKGEA